MAGPWLYTISPAAEFGFKDGPKKGTLKNYRELVESERLAEDPRWFISQNWMRVEVEDEMYIYSGEAGIVGWATIEKIDKEERFVVPAFDFKRCRKLLRDNPVPATVVKSWPINSRKNNLTDLGPVEHKLRILLPEDFWNSEKTSVVDRDLTDDEIDQRLQQGRLLLTDVPTDNPEALVRQRRGQDRLRKLILEQYSTCCAVCDITDPKLLIASHIVPWSESPEHRGILSNAICLCRLHDALFEYGYWSLDDDLKPLTKESVTSQTIQKLLDVMTSFRKPDRCAPSPQFMQRHRQRWGFES